MKRARWFGGGAVLLLVALFATVAALLGTDRGVHWLADNAARLSAGKLQIAQISGHLGTPLRVGKLVVTTDTQRITATQLRLDWQPRALLQRRVEIALLAVQTLRIETLKPGPPPTLPTSLRLPFDLHVAVWDVAQLEWIDAGQTLVFKTLHGALDGSGAQYRLRAAATTPWASANAVLALGKDAPFALHGRVDAQRAAPLPLQARADLDGTLAAIEFATRASAPGMQFQASGSAAPFARVKLVQLVLAGQGIDPRQFVATAPHADVAFSGVFEGRPGERLLGTFSLANRIPGRLDQGRVPLASVVGAVLGDARAADFSSLALDLGAAGKFTGSGQWRDGSLALALNSERFNLAGLQRKLDPTRLRTRLQFTASAARQTLAADVAAPWGQGRVRLSLANSVLRLDAAQFGGDGGRLAASGSLTLDPTRAFALRFDASKINPARFGKFPQAQLNARGDARGRLVPALTLQTQFTLPPGRLEGRPVQGRGRLRYANAHLLDADIELDLAGNRAQLKGAYGRVGDTLAWHIDAPALARLKLGLGGRVESSGTLAGDPRQPQISARFDAAALRLPGAISAQTIRGQVELQAAARGVFAGQIDARDVQRGDLHLDSLRANLRGRRDAHTLVLDLRLPHGRVNATLAGGLDTAQRWRGQLQSAGVQGRWPLRLLAPATLTIARDRQQLANLAFTFAGGQVELAQLDRQGDAFVTRGSLKNLPLAPLLALAALDKNIATDLRVDGNWNLRAGATLDGDATLARRSGDARLLDPALDLGLKTLALKLHAAASQLDASLDIDTRDAGRAHADAHAMLARSGAFYQLPRGAPLTWTARVDVPDLRLARVFLPLGMRVDARLGANLVGSGSLAAPRVSGQIDASAIRFALPEQGVAISDGSLQLALADDRVRVVHGELKGAADAGRAGGRIVLSGSAQLRHPQAGLVATFEKFLLTNRSDRHVTVSGVTQLHLDPKQLALTGQLGVDRARLDMPEADRPQLSSDVVIVGAPPRPVPASQRIPLALDLGIKLGDDFLFKGGGLDARLGGQLRVYTRNQALLGEGTIQVAKGRYAAYGQSLDIARGVLRFAGPVGNPGIDVLAVRKTSTVTAGVQVSGTVQRPLVTLYSDPAMADTDKLAWLVLGHGLENGGQEEYALLQVAAGALLNQAESVNMQSKLAEALHIDSVGVRAGSGEGLATTVVSVGKRLSSRATLSYEQSIDGLSQVVKILYQVSPHVRLEAQAGQPSSFDAFYTLEFD